MFPTMYNAWLCWHLFAWILFLSTLHHLNSYLLFKFDHKRNYLKYCSESFSRTGLSDISGKIAMCLTLIVKSKRDIVLTNTIIIVSHPNYEAQEYNHHYIETFNIFSEHLAFVNAVTIKCA